MDKFIEVNSFDDKSLINISRITRISYDADEGRTRIWSSDDKYVVAKASEYDKIIKILKDYDLIITEREQPNKLPNLSTGLPNVAKNLPDLDHCVLINESATELDGPEDLEEVTE